MQLTSEGLRRGLVGAELGIGTLPGLGEDPDVKPVIGGQFKLDDVICRNPPGMGPDWIHSTGGYPNRPVIVGYRDAGLVLMPGQHELRPSEPGS